MLIQGIQKRGRTELSWERTLDRALVHRDAIAEVLLTDIVQLDETSFEVAAQWSRSHRVYRPDHEGRHDPMLLLETVRQTGLALSHHGFGVPFDYKSVMHDVGFRVWPEAEPRAVQAATNVTIRVECENVVLRGDQLRSMTVVLAMSVDGVHFATGCGSLSWLPERTFAALRARNGGRLPRQRGGAGDGHPAGLEVPRGRRLADRRGGPAASSPASAGAARPPGVLRPSARPRTRHGADRRGLAGGHRAQAGEPLRLVECSMQCPAFTELFDDA